MRVAHFGTFDVENYGDLLFPLVLRRRLEDLGVELTCVSPVGGPPVWGDCVASTTVETLAPSAFDAVVLGGGNIVHAGPAGVARYQRDGTTALFAYAGLWSDAARLAAEAGIPLCWNAPGLPQDLLGRAADLLRACTMDAEPLTVRDHLSRRRLHEAGVDRPVHVTCDTALDVSRLWTEAEIDAAHEALFADRNADRPRRTLAIHLNRRYLGADIQEVADEIDGIAALARATPVLLALGPCHGDDELVGEVAARMRVPAVAVPRPRSLREAAAAIGRADAYVGSSLHGMVTACSFGVPGLIVAREPSGSGKFSGFLELVGLEEALVPSWAAAARELPSILHPQPARHERLREAWEPQLDAHWTRMRGSLTGHGHNPVEVPSREHAIRTVLPLAAEQLVGSSRSHRARAAASAAALAAAEGRLGALTAELGAAQERILETSGEAEALRAELARARRDQTEAAGAAREELRAERERASAREDELEERLRRTRTELDAAVKESEAHREQASARLAHGDQLGRELRESAGRIERLQADLEERSGALDQTLDEAAAAGRAIDRALGELALIQDLATRVEGSRSWRLGHALMRAGRALLLRPAKGEGAMPLLVAHATNAKQALAAHPRRRAQPAPRTAAGNGRARSITRRADEARAATAFLTRWEELAGEPGGPPRDRHGVLIASGEPRPAPSVDVVVCVHNALEDVDRCLRSLLDATAPPFGLIVVNDGSDDETAEYLERFARSAPAAVLLTNAGPDHGYTIAANLGLRASTADYVVLLNSDTIVTPAGSTASSSAARPMSTSASSARSRTPRATSRSRTPRRTATGRSTTRSRAGSPPRAWRRAAGGRGARRGDPGPVPQRLLLRRQATDDRRRRAASTSSTSRGLLRGERLRRPRRRGGLRAGGRDDGRTSSTRSRGPSATPDRKAIAKRNYQKFLEQHGDDRISGLVAELDGNPDLASTRRPDRGGADRPRPCPATRCRGCAIVLRPAGHVAGGSGGSHSIYQEVSAMRALGVDAPIALQQKALRRAAWRLPRRRRGVRRRTATQTTSPTSPAGRRHRGHALQVGRCSSRRSCADGTTSCPPTTSRTTSRSSRADSAGAHRRPAILHADPRDACCFAKTHWLCNIVGRRHGVRVAKVEPSIDQRSTIATAAATRARACE